MFVRAGRWAHRHGSQHDSEVNSSEEHGNIHNEMGCEPKSNFQHGALVIQHHHDPTSNLHLLGDLKNSMKFINMPLDE